MKTITIGVIVRKNPHTRSVRRNSLIGRLGEGEEAGVDGRRSCGGSVGVSGIGLLGLEMGGRGGRSLNGFGCTLNEDGMEFSPRDKWQAMVPDKGENYIQRRNLMKVMIQRE